MGATPYGEYEGRRVIVTGCTSGIGRATTEALLELGAEVHGVDRQVPDLGLAGFETLDLADPPSIDRAVGRIGGHVDALFNCAGATPMIPPLELLKVNFLGTRHLTDRVLELMSGGAVVRLAPDAGHVA